MSVSSIARREFVKRTGAIAATGVAAPMLLNLAATGRLAAAQASDYRALVCVFLYGGNDQYNTVVPHDATNHATYAHQRPGIATARAALYGTTLDGDPLPNGVRYALAPQLKRLHGLWRDGQLAIALNAGTLVQPINKPDYATGRVPLPRNIFSHNDQQKAWQSLAAGDLGAEGWGGRMLDAFTNSNADEAFSAVSVSGDALMLSSAGTMQYRLSASGAVGLNAKRWPIYGSKAVSSALQSLMTAEHDHLLRAPLGATATRGIAANDRLAAAFAATEDAGAVEGFPAHRLGAQLRTVARLLTARDALRMKRQVFFVGLGGFDHHGGLAAGHPQKLAALDESLHAFQLAVDRLGLGAAVTTFTASEFGRTLSSNGDGSDHGWGSHHFVLGGAVQGGRFYGRPPVLANDGPDDVGRGRLLPTTSVDQLSGTLGRWFGATAGEIDDVFPNLAGFDATDLGFMRAA